MRLDTNSNVDFKAFDSSSSSSSNSCIVKLDNLATWGGSQKTDTRLPITDYSTLGGPRHNCSPFPLSKDVNNRLVIWDGDMTTLDVDAITNSSDETLTESNIISERIIAVAGNQLKEELSTTVKECRIGDVRVTRGYNLPAKYVLHTVAPAYKEKLKTAAENALHCCYRNVLCKAKELNLRTIAVCNVSSNQKSFPADVAAHIALRTIRRYLDKFTQQVVILCVNSSERGTYEVLAPLYFPRDQLEERSALWQLPKDTGGELGEPQHPDPDRQIRIIRNPQHSHSHSVHMRHRQTDDDSDVSPHDMEGNSSDLEYGTRDMNGLSLNSYSSGLQAQLQLDLDRQHLLSDRPRTGVYESVVAEGIEGMEHQERYERLLQRAQVEDLNEVSGIGCLYQSGVDRLGRPVIVFCGKWFPAQNVDLEKALLYLIKLLDPIVKGDYVIAYFHTLTSTNNYPSLHWLREVYSVLPYKYKKNLKAFYIVHPTFWTKMMTWWFTTFMAPAIKAKVHSLPGVEHLYSAITKDQLEIPAYITEYDMATNGLHYFNPVPTAS
ncbi:protein GDAP2 homolog isoform X1 [Drosophila innubila]|uniref:protein GDAP2 homolog isoform X1 n=2 Tax=Drosophila innubila TaxID=198719 RepID=UPI00148D648C|nr:protein GDAP2 homolog isoform X1 [Drosophila innubila]XP_034476854.1 protein GDAP2 homolog isoform X1 [Drosophila innubila]XP_034476855.1 protein GDAP2 homolog isoform X1 [Drosophila innubila]XP_034476856.1 protein GDAP2 homolog isoform X1 [Drosophila innubila]